MAFSPDGARVLSGSADKTLKLWDTATGQLLRTFEGHSDSVESVAFSPDGAWALSGSADKTLKLWDAVTGQLLRTFEGHSRDVNSVAFSPDGARVLSGSGDATLLWDAATGHLLRTVNSDGRSVAYSPDGTRLLSGNWDKTLKLWDAATGQLLRTFEGHSSSIGSVAFSPDGARVLSGSGELVGKDNTLKLWDAATGQLLRTFEGHSSDVNSVAFSPDGARVLSGSSDDTLKLWDAATGQLLRTFQAHSISIRSVAFSPDGARVLSSSVGDTLKLWDSATGQLLRTFEGLSRPVSSVAFSPDGARLLSANEDKTLKLWDAATGQLLRTFEGHSSSIGSVAFSPDGARVLSGSGEFVGKDNTLKLWDAATGQLLRTFEGHSSAVHSVAFSPDGARLLSGSWDKTLKLWDAATGQLLRTFEGHGGDAHFGRDLSISVAFSSDGARLLSGSWDTTLKLWDATKGQLLRTFEGHSEPVLSVAFSPDGARVLSGSGDKTLKLWDAATGRLLRTFEGHSSYVESVRFSSDGARVLSGSSDGTLKLWDAATGGLQRTFEGHSGPVHSVAFSPDGARLLSGSSDATVRIWNLETGRLLVSVIAAPDDAWLAITPEGFFAASRKGTEMVGVVRGFEGFSVMQFYDHLHRPDLIEEVLKGDLESKYKDAVGRINLRRILDSGPTPRIELLPNRTERTGDTVKLAARLSDMAGGIGGKVIWRVNGTTQGATTMPGLAGPPYPGRYVVMAQTLTVDPGRKNEIEIIAYNSPGLMATPPLRFTIDPFGVTTQDRPRMFVLAVGVNNYLKKSWQLQYATKDATELGEALKKVGGSLFSHVFVTTLLNPEATESNIAAAFETMAEKVKPRDVFVLFLGGHGRSIAGSGWFFLPQDLDLEAKPQQTIEANGIGQDKWQRWMAKIAAEKSVVILDACESGAGEWFRGNEREQEAVMAQLENATGRNIIAAAPQGKAALEGYRGHGVLTYAVLEALNKPAGGAEETVDVYGIAAHVSRQVPLITQREFGIRQKPEPKLHDNFPLGYRQALLSAPATATDAAAPARSTVPSHAVIRPVDVYAKASKKAAVAQKLAKGAKVTINRRDGAWALIERDGAEIGYVAFDALLELN